MLKKSKNINGEVFMDNQYLCTNCGYMGKAKTITRGSLGIEIALWLLFLFPGFIYTLWRFTSKFKGCSKCNKDSLIPADSPKAQAVINK